MTPPVAATSGPIEAPDKEAIIKRNPHADWSQVEASRPPYSGSDIWSLSKTPVPTWQAGDGASSEIWEKLRRLEIRPYDDDRTTVQNYKLMISTTVPRPIALVTTVSLDGVSNMAPFSYFQLVSTDVSMIHLSMWESTNVRQPPLYSLSLVGDDPNDTLRNIMDTKECTINIISDWFVEASNMSSVNTPPQMSEWPLTGLHPYPSKDIKPASVAESAVSAECRLHSHQDIINKEGKRTATLVLVEAVVWHIREDLLAKDPAKASADLALLRPVWRGGGITYGTCFQGFELPRPAAWRKVKAEQAVAAILA
jgi:flavin reductase (DIM6/NTAB) family NADH-FMN oxidoreductase RutF